ncbi:hypothetical protein [Skermania piniformis]|uniref:Uncharacterized protein n=1 Tax=Skermania pinensis TaxID=39122 RepID=A0ABX8SCH7_9ACTN|nr:hypothetical protein [Skermania piniformis]QXQ15131.1 hypothetical protein KV203_07250 [Skermania piniformis]
MDDLEQRLRSQLAEARSATLTPAAADRMIGEIDQLRRTATGLADSAYRDRMLALAEAALTATVRGQERRRPALVRPDDPGRRSAISALANLLEGQGPNTPVVGFVPPTR